MGKTVNTKYQFTDQYGSSWRLSPAPRKAMVAGRNIEVAAIGKRVKEEKPLKALAMRRVIDKVEARRKRFALDKVSARDVKKAVREASVKASQWEELRVGDFRWVATQCKSGVFLEAARIEKIHILVGDKQKRAEGERATYRPERPKYAMGVELEIAWCNDREDLARLSPQELARVDAEGGMDEKLLLLSGHRDRVPASAADTLIQDEEGYSIGGYVHPPIMKRKRGRSVVVSPAEVHMHQRGPVALTGGGHDLDKSLFEAPARRHNAKTVSPETVD